MNQPEPRNPIAARCRRALAAIALAGAAFEAVASSDCQYGAYGGAGFTLSSPNTINGISVSGSGNALQTTGSIATVSGVTLPALSPATFPGGGSTASVASGGTLAPGTYTTVTAAGSLVLQPGTYYVHSLTLGGNLTISPAGVVQFYVGGSFGASSSVQINASGSPVNFQVYLYSGASFTLSGNGSKFTGFLYSPFSNSSFFMEDHATVNGAVISAGTVHFGDTNTFTYSAANQAALEALPACSGSGGSTGGSGGPAAMNAVDVGASATAGKIGTKTAGIAFTLDLYALNAGKTAVDTTNGSAILVDLLANTVTGTGLDAGNCPTSYTALAVGTFTFSSGKVTAASMGAVADAWRDVRVRIRYPSTGSASVTACSSDNFAIKPATLAVQASDATASTAGTARILNSSGASGTPVHKAGQPFTLSVSAWNGAGTPAVTSNYAGTVAVTAPTAVSPATVAGTLATGTFGASGGTITSNTATYTEAGAITLVLQDSTFASVDSGDGTAASCSGYYVCSAATTIGRFVPDHFAISPSPPSPACNGFTYFGQDFSTPFVITAQNAANATTQNYAGSLARLALTGWAAFAFTASGAPAGSALASGATAPTGSWSLGVASVGASQSLSAPATPSPPAAVTILAQPVDSDGVTLPAAVAITSSAATIYQGRARMQNAIGPETLDLPVPFRIEYWQGALSGWQLNSADTCTTTNLVISSGTLAASSTCVRDSASPGASGAGCTGASPIGNHKFLEGGVSGTDANGVTGFAGNFNLWLKGTGAGNLGYVSLSATVPSWLQYNWSGSLSNPSAIATFGLAKSGPVLYRVEHY